MWNHFGWCYEDEMNYFLFVFLVQKIKTTITNSTRLNWNVGKKKGIERKLMAIMRDKILNIYIQSIMVANMETKTNYIKIQNEKKKWKFLWTVEKWIPTNTRQHTAYSGRQNEDCVCTTITKLIPAMKNLQLICIWMITSF